MNRVNQVCIEELHEIMSLHGIEQLLVTVVALVFAHQDVQLVNKL